MDMLLNANAFPPLVLVLGSGNKLVPEEENMIFIHRPTAANFNASNGEMTVNGSTWPVTQGSLFRQSSPKNFSPSIFNHMLPRVAYNWPWPWGGILMNRKWSLGGWKILLMLFNIWLLSHRWNCKKRKKSYITCKWKNRSVLSINEVCVDLNSKLGVFLVLSFCL